jgi:hypothetical protein
VRDREHVCVCVCLCSLPFLQSHQDSITRPSLMALSNPNHLPQASTLNPIVISPLQLTMGRRFGMSRGRCKPQHLLLVGVPPNKSSNLESSIMGTRKQGLQPGRKVQSSPQIVGKGESTGELSSWPGHQPPRMEQSEICPWLLGAGDGVTVLGEGK